MKNYDLLYQKEDYYGKPYEVIENFFDRLDKRGKLLDIGCGQGRNAIPLAKMEYEVRGIDTSDTGLKQMKDRAEAEKLNLVGENMDVYSVESFSEYDVVLVDSFFTFERRKKEDESRLVEKILKELKKGSYFCSCMDTSEQAMEELTEIIMNSSEPFEIMYDNIAEYPEFNDFKHILILVKI